MSGEETIDLDQEANEGKEYSVWGRSLLDKGTVVFIGHRCLLRSLADARKIFLDVPLAAILNPMVFLIFHISNAIPPIQNSQKGSALQGCIRISGNLSVLAATRTHVNETSPRLLTPYCNLMSMLHSMIHLFLGTKPDRTRLTWTTVP